MELAFQAPVAGTIKEVIAQKGQQVAAGDVILVIEEAAEDEVSAGDRSRLKLPAQVDPRALLFRPNGDGPLSKPDLAVADQADLASRRVAIDAAREEIRRVLMGYDVNTARGERLAAFLEAPLPDALSESFRWELSEVRHELALFADVAVVFSRAPQADADGAPQKPASQSRAPISIRCRSGRPSRNRLIQT